jgi:DNA-binding MarR family transcriptional regulator
MDNELSAQELADNEVAMRAAKIEALLPRILRMIYKSTEDSVLAQLPLAQFRIIRVLYAGPRTITSLGEELALTSSAVTQMANRLQDANLIERVEDLEDRRVKHLALTPHAYEMMRARQERRVKRMEQALKLITPERQVEIVQNLEELLQAGGEIPVTEALWYVAELELAVPVSPPYRS